MAKIVHKNRLFRVEELKMKGHSIYRVVEEDVAVILAFIDKDHIFMEKQMRPSIGKVLYEIPAGHINKNEDPVKAANRELEEETGYKAMKLKLLTKYYISPGSATTFQYIFVATDLVKGKISRDPDEKMDLFKMSLKKAYGLVKSGKIIDAKTIMAITCYMDNRKVR